MSESTAPIIGFIGLGIMGGAMVANLLRGGHTVVVNDVKREAAEPHLANGASWADTARDVAARSHVVFTCLPSLPAIESVWLGPNSLFHGVSSGKALFEMSTNSIELLKKLDVAFREKGAHVLDAPISGGAKGAKRGRMGIWVGGDRASYDRYESVLKIMGDRPIHVGALGTGLVTKLVHNSASQTMQAALAEVFVLGVKAGAEPLALWEAIRQGSIGRRRSFDGLADEFLPGRFEPPSAALRIIHKDMMLATGLGRELGVPMRIANLALADIIEAMNRGWAERDCRSVMLLPQERAGVSIKVDPDLVDEVMRRDPAAPTDTKRGEGA